MHVPNSHGRPRHRWRPPFAAMLMLTLATLTGMAQAVEFDEKVRAPMMKGAAEFKAQAQALAARYAAIREAAPEQLIRDPALAREKFDLRWQVQSAIDGRQPLDGFDALGLTPRGDGSYSVDMGEHPEWNDLHELMAGMLSRANLESTGPALVSRGFRPEDVETLRQYVAAGNPDTTAAAATLPITLGFGRTVRKYDKIKRAVPEAVVSSYLYQRTRVSSESNRLWVQGLFDRLDAQRRRVLLSTFFESTPVTVWAPENLAAGTAELLAAVRRPDFEERVKAEAMGAAP
jgi:hypothetical protein